MMTTTTATDERPYQSKKSRVTPEEARKLVMRTRRKGFFLFVTVELGVGADPEGPMIQPRITTVELSQKAMADHLRQFQASSDHRVANGREPLYVSVSESDWAIHIG